MTEVNPYLNPDKYLQPQEIPEGETIGDFVRWWKTQCAVWDNRPKQIIKRDPDRWSSSKKGGKRK